MMLMWVVIMWTILAVFGLSFFYLYTRMHHFFNQNTFNKWSKKKRFFICFGILFLLFLLTVFLMDMVNAIVCVIYFALVWLVCNLFCWMLKKILRYKERYYYAGWAAVVLSLAFLGTGWYLNHHVWQTYYTITTEKRVPDLKLVMFADSHIGTTFNATGFSKHVQAMQSENPDVVVVVGDFVDDSTTKKDMIESCKLLGELKTKYGVYFVLGNHDKGYYGSKYRGFSFQDLIDELQKNGVFILRDEVVLLDDSFYLIGRKDYSEIKEQGKHRQSMSELVDPLDEDKYMIVLDHQPADYDNQADSGVDLVLSGHTHGGQLFPFNQVGKWIGANDLIYGHEKRKNTNFIVTSGISDWAIKFKTGTKSEYVVVEIQNKK